VAYTYTHTYIHTYIHIYTHTYIHTYIRTHGQLVGDKITASALACFDAQAHRALSQLLSDDADAGRHHTPASARTDDNTQMARVEVASRVHAQGDSQDELNLRADDADVRSGDVSRRDDDEQRSGGDDMSMASAAARESESESEKLTEANFSERVHTNFEVIRSDGSGVEVVPGGALRAVTWENRREYAHMAIRARLNESKVQMRVLSRGLRTMVPAGVLTLLGGSELERMVTHRSVAVTVYLSLHTKPACFSRSVLSVFLSVLSVCLYALRSLVHLYGAILTMPVRWLFSLHGFQSERRWTWICCGSIQCTGVYLVTTTWSKTSGR
jgi:hypothetical protein